MVCSDTNFHEIKVLDLKLLLRRLNLFNLSTSGVVACVSYLAANCHNLGRASK